MNYIYFTRTTLVLIVCVCLLGTPTRAEDPRFLSNYHTEYGLKLLNDRKFDVAVERFIKAFLLDPQNKVAKESLQKIVSDQVVSTSHGLKILRFIDQVEYLNFLTMRYEGLIQENARLLDFFRNNKSIADDAAALEKFRAIESKITAQPSALPQVGLIGFADENTSVDVSVIASELSNERQALAKEVSFWEEQNEQLRSLRRTFLAQNSTQTPAALANKFKSEVDEFKERVAEKDQLLAVQQQNVEYFKTELTSVRENFNALQERFKETDLKIAELTNRIASMSVEIYEKDKTIGEKEARAVNLENELVIATEKMNLVQKIIQEKDDHVRERIISLEVQYADLTTKYQAVLQDLQVRDAQLAGLRDSAIKEENLAKKYRDAFFVTDQKANQLIGMVEIYREKLRDAKQSLSAKEEELRQLQGALFPPAAESREQDASPKAIESTPSYDLTFSQNRDDLQAR